MSPTLNIPIKKLTLENLLDLFKISHNCYDTEWFDSQIRFLKSSGFEELKTIGQMQYGINMKFIIETGRKNNIHVCVNTYGEDDSETEHKARFDKAVTQYFKNELILNRWEFVVRPGNEEEFIKLNGPKGEWFKFFRPSPNFLDTRLLKEQGLEIPQPIYITDDRWLSLEGFNRYIKNNRKQYKDLSEQNRKLCLKEHHKGQFRIV